MRTFHDAVIVHVAAEADVVSIRVQDVVVFGGSGGGHETGWLRVEGVRAIEHDRVPTDAGHIMAGFDDGQILELSMGEGVLEILVEWQNYAERRTRTSSVRLEGRRVCWTPDVLARS